MCADEHVRTAGEFLIWSDRYFADGDRLQGSEVLWGTAAHSILALSRLRRWPVGSHSRLRENPDRRSIELGESHISTDFDAAERFHANFYHGYMTDSDIGIERPLVHRFVSRVLVLPELSGLTS
jgi:hypothetical protein